MVPQADSRIFLMRSDDLVHWDDPELLRVKGDAVPREEMERMIDPYLLEDKDEPGKFWCFYKQAGVSLSWSRDLVHWSTGTITAAPKAAKTSAPQSSTANTGSGIRPKTESAC